ncbi:uncharacterized protein Tco025E_09648 [Trypanosoma conorhini]|uniref:Regulator of chromosome condensation 1-like protein n=1 Tax=Trypanosoma conorhini TaxID=83891 RepID=A0A422MUA8_9TRYP|nr:uncharacterized protein Tco025E_09648 [Trypanosoma conorhini]RNE96783.1 hypothetical protein Tco025E_09648 [Trypanosoma conorhini]
MFFWGNYNFQTPTLVEHPERPALRYPLYVPPAPSMVTDDGAHARMANGAGDVAGETLRRIDSRHLAVKFLACGQKHLVAVLMPVEHNHDAAVAAAGARGSVTAAVEATPSSSFVSCDHDGKNWLVYGMGSNHSGQLGHRVPEYTTTLTRLYVEGLLSAGTTVSGLACGNKHTLVCMSAGGVFASGDNSCGQLGVTANVSGFAPVAGLAHIKAVYAAGNASFALNNKGELYAWGEAQYGHLCHGDNGERMDARTLQTVKTNVKVPTLVQWFVRHHVVILEVAAARGHVVCRSSDEVYTCGEGYYGKLGTGNLAPALTPQRVRFPERAHPERLCGIAAGDDHTLVLRDSPVVGAVVYHFGKMGNGDGQLTPIVVTAPASTTRIGAGRGTMSTAVTGDGLLYVWGKHSQPKVSNGTPAEAKRGSAEMVAALTPFLVADAVIGGTFVVALATSCRRPVEAAQTATEPTAATNGSSNQSHAWDVIVPHDARVDARGTEGAGAKYEEAVEAFIAQYLGPLLGPMYVADMPKAPPPTDRHANAFAPVGAHALTIGQKIRLWMTDVYALGTVVEVLPPHTSPKRPGVAAAAAPTDAAEETDYDGNAAPTNGPGNEDKNDVAAGGEPKPGCRLRVEWQRDDWHDEVLTLYSEDETLDPQNPNRWQPLWFLPNPNASDEYLLGQ